MGCRLICTIWLASGIGLVCANGLKADPPNVAAQQQAAARIPLDQVPENVRARVNKVVERPTLFGHGPAEAFAGRPELYLWLLDHPDRAVTAWRRLGATCTEITERGPGRFVWKDVDGSEIHWQTAYATNVLRVWYAEGKVRPGPLLPLVPVKAVLLLRHGDRPDGPGRTLIFHQADVFLQTDSKTASLLTQAMGPSAPRLAEQGLGQVEMFFSGLVWYLDKHPERIHPVLSP